MNLPADLRNEIANFLMTIPSIQDNKSQQAFISAASLDTNLKNQIEFSGPSVHFFNLLIPVLLDYGTLEDGREPVEAVLETAKSYVGQNRKQDCDILIQKLRSILNPPDNSTHPGPESGKKLNKGTTVCFNWLHLTDLHTGMKEQNWLWPGVREIFFEDLKKLHDKCGPWDMVLFTGDLTQKGNTKEFAKMNELLEQLWNHLNKLGSSPKLLAVPGNHDLVRPKKETSAVKLIKKWADHPDVQNEFWENPKSEYRRVVTTAFKNHTAWWDAQSFRPDGIKTGIIPGDFSVTFEKQGVKLGIVGLNTSFLQLTGDNYKGKLAIHGKQFHEACGGDGPAWAKQHHACLLLTHHPPVWLNNDSKQYLNGEITDHARFAVHICGHLHETASREISDGGTEARRIWQGRSLFGLEHFVESTEGERLHGYTAGRIEIDEKGSLIFWPREARLQGAQRSIVPDYSVNLTDDQHTQPREFKMSMNL